MLEPEPTVSDSSWSRAGAEILKEPELEPEPKMKKSPAPETLLYTKFCKMK